MIPNQMNLLVLTMPNAVHNTWKTIIHRSLKPMCNKGLKVRQLMMDFVYSGKLRKYQLEFKRLFKQYLLDPKVEAKASD